jgi:hypothetical protein
VCIGTPLCWQHLLSQMNLRIKPSVNGPGKGLFAMMPRQNDDGPRRLVFKQNDYICDYGGEKITKRELDARYGNYTAPYALFVRQRKGKGGHYVNAACMRGVGAMANHANAARANARLAPMGASGALKATKPIYEGDEILVDYGSEYGFQEPVIDKTHWVSRRSVAARPRLRG